MKARILLTLGAMLLAACGGGTAATIGATSAAGSTTGDAELSGVVFDVHKAPG